MFPRSVPRARACRKDIRVSPNGKRFFVADMEADGVHVVDGETPSGKSVSFPPVWLRMACTYAVTAGACM